MNWEDHETKMQETLVPGDDIWDKFGLNNVLMNMFPGLDGNYEYDVSVLGRPKKVVTKHDCMWSGTCSSNKHIRCYERKPQVVAVSVAVQPVKCGRSLLRTNRVRSRSPNPRPETPSESEEEEISDHSASVKGSDSEDISMLVSVSEVTGQISRTKCEMLTSPPPTPATSPAFHSDHSYHQNKTGVALDNLGVQTPSDSDVESEWRSVERSSCRDIVRTSEEEIDVVSVADREKLTTLPTNPSAKDKQQLQQKVASAIEQQRRSRSRKNTATPPEKHRSPAPRNKRRRYARSDSVQDVTCEKRNLHNNMERLRRIDLRDSIIRLRKMLPDLTKNERAAKVVVLKEAVKYIRLLENLEKKNRLEKANLAATQMALKAKVRNLRLGNAKCRGFIPADHLPLPELPALTPAEEKVPRKKRMGSRCEKRRRKAGEYDEEWTIGTGRKTRLA